jgi:hypothetical protein
MEGELFDESVAESFAESALRGTIPTAACDNGCTPGSACPVLPAGDDVEGCCAQALNSEPQSKTKHNASRLRTQLNLPNTITQPRWK